MNLPPLQIKSLLKKYNLTPKKSLGQNFLVDHSALLKVAQAAGDLTDRFVLEIGPGLGSLTRLICQAALSVVAVEIDQRLMKPLADILDEFDNVRIINGDILEVDLAEILPSDGFDVIANIPYYITSILIRKLLESSIKPDNLVMTIQKEVADRICAHPGDHSLLSLGVQVYGVPVIVDRIPAEAFYPVPGVDSAILKIEIHSSPIIPIENLDIFFQLAKAGFSQKRKMLRKSLAAGLKMTPAEAEALLRLSGIDPGRRAETVSLEEWGSLTELYLRKSR